MWSDKETDLDCLNYSEVAELALDLIKDPNMLPLSLGIFGGWGSGKSSMLCLIKKAIALEENNFITVEFDAWLYQDYDDARAALMDVIASTLLEKAEKNEPLIQKIKGFAKRINYFRLLGLSADIGVAAMGVPVFGALTTGSEALGRLIQGESVKDDYEAFKEVGKEVKSKTEGLIKPQLKANPPEEIATFRREFGEILKSLNKTLVVFIDNLDRCLPRNAIHTLEAVRLFLFLPSTAFVIAADEDMIRHAVSEHYGNLNERLVTDYLDKLIQVPIQVPRLGVHEVRAYMFMLFAGVAALDATILEDLRSGLEKSLRQSWREEPLSINNLIKMIPGISADLVRNFQIADRMAAILAKSSRVQGNPRIVKRMLNVVRMRSSVARRRGMPLDEALIAKFALFERCTDVQSTSELYRVISEAANGKSELLKYLEKVSDDVEKLKEVCPEQWRKHLEFLSEWVTLEPYLADIDLRPVLYLSRETLALRYSKAGLSASGAQALITLMRAPTRASKAAQQAVTGLESPELLPLMEALISELRKESNWNKKPNGFDGALVLADKSVEAGKLLGTFINSLGLAKLPPWLNVIVKDVEWYTESKGK